MKDSREIQDVNIELGDNMSRMLYEASRLTFENRPGLVETRVDSFSGFRAIDGDYLGDMRGHVLQIGLDGVGTKVEIAERTKIHRTIAHDLFAMICDDAAVRGGEPLVVGSVLDVNQLNDNDETRDAMRQLAEGYVKAARASGTVVLNGELAELGGRIDGYTESFLADRGGQLNYNWAGVVLWDALKSRVLDGSALSPGDSLVGFKENGFRSNGITDVRKAMMGEYGPEWHNQTVHELGDITLGELVLKPSTIYCKAVTSMHGGRDPDRQPLARISAVSHITGGGQPSKLGRMLEASGCGVIIDKPLNPPKIMLHVQSLRGLDDSTAYGKWHMGPGMVVATPEPEKVIAEASNHDIEAQEIGYVTDVPVIRILNRGAQQDEEWLTFSLA